MHSLHEQSILLEEMQKAKSKKEAKHWLLRARKYVEKDLKDFQLRLLSQRHKQTDRNWMMRMKAEMKMLKLKKHRVDEALIEFKRNPEKFSSNFKENTKKSKKRRKKAPPKFVKADLQDVDKTFALIDEYFN